MPENHQTSKVNYSKRAILSDLLQGRLTVEQTIEQKLFTSENEILAAIVKLIHEEQRYRYVNKIESQLTRHSSKPVVSRLPVAHAEVVSPVSTFHMISNKPLLTPSPTAAQADPTHGPESERQKPNRSLAGSHYEQALGLSFPDNLHSLSDFQMFVVEKIREQKLTLQVALDADIFSFAGTDELTLAEQAAMINDNAGNYIGATKLSEEMNMIRTQGRGDHVADGVIVNDIQSEHNKEKTDEELQIQKNYDALKENQDEQNDDYSIYSHQNGDKEQADDEYKKTKVAEQTKINEKWARNNKKVNRKTIDEQHAQTVIAALEYPPPMPSNTK